MYTASILRSSLRQLAILPVALAALFYGSSSIASAQNVAVPVPFASTAAGGGTVCAASISTYAPLASNKKLVGDGCPATQATFNTPPVALAIDRYNNVIVADQTNNLIRVIYNGGTAMAAAIVASNAQVPSFIPQKGYIYLIIGGPQSTPTESTFYCTETGNGIVGLNKELDGCPGAYAYVQPRGMATDQDGNVFFSNFGGNFSVRVFYVGGTTVANLIALENPTLTGAPQPGYVYEIAGTGVPSNTTGGDGGLAYKANVAQPRGLWVDSNEDVYISDTTDGLIRRVDATTGLISTVAGNCTASPSCPVTASAGDGNPATSSAVKINAPYGLVFDSYGNMFIADSGSGTAVAGRVRVVYAGGTLPGVSNPVVGDIYTYAGGGATSGTQAQQTTFQYVYGVGIDANGYLYVNDYRSGSTASNHVWRVDPTNGNIVNIAGSGGTVAQTAGGYCSNSAGTLSLDTRGDGCSGPQTYMNLPQQAPVFDSLGNFYIVERNTNVVRYFYYTNTFPSTPVGSSVTQAEAFAFPFGTTSAPATFLTDGAASTDFSDAGNGVCVGAGSTPQATVCVTNVTFAPKAGNAREGSIIASSSPTVVATEALIGVGSAAQVTVDPGTSISLGTSIKPQGVSVDLLGNVYLSDGAGKQVLKTTLAGGTPTAVFTGLGSPQGTTTDSFGNVYVADAANNAVLQLSKSSGAVSTVITGLSAPTGMAADIRGDVYVADTGNNRVLRYSPLSGVSSTVSFHPQTLSAPTGLAMDASGDLYVLDSGNQRILELPPATLPQTVTLPASVIPSAFALDHAGNLYLADTASDTLLIAPTAGSEETLKTGLATPVGLAIDTNGDLFLADSSTSSVLGLKRTLSTDVFASTNVGQQSLLSTLTLSSIGDLSATLGSPLFTETGSSGDFPATTSPSNSCSASLVLASGAYCSESFLFAPTTTGARSATVTFTPATGAAVGANLSGTGVNLIKTTLSITQTVPTTTTVSYGQATTFVATLTGTSTSPAATGKIMFVVDGTTVLTQNVGSSGNTLTDNLAVGTHVISAIYTGDSIYASSNTSFSLTVNKSPTTTTISSSQSVNGVTLSAVVTPTYSGAVSMTGTVTFYVSGIAQLPSQPVGNGTVSQVVNVADGTYPVTAVYSGDGNYATSTSLAGTLTVKRTPTTTVLMITPVTTATSVSLQLLITVTGAGGDVPVAQSLSANGIKDSQATGTLSSAGIYTYSNAVR